MPQPLQTEAGNERQGSFLPLRKDLAEHVVAQFDQQRLGLGAVEDRKPRIDARLDRMGPQQRRAKRVDRADPCRIEVPQQREPIFGFLLGTLLVFEPLLAGLADAVAHFPCGALGERDGHQFAQPRPAVAVRPAVRLQLAQEPLGQDLGLAAPAPADTATDGPRASTARRCCSVKPGLLTRVSLWEAILVPR